VDILLVPAGGEGISPKDAAAITKAIAPRVVIPMAYSTAAMEGPDAKLRPLDAFVSATPYAVTNKDLDTILIGPADLPSSTEIYTLKLRRE
jgi:L-ascorbate metabolism protein UlaG (beta-lactamase superfamily)